MQNFLDPVATFRWKRRARWRGVADAAELGGMGGRRCCTTRARRARDGGRLRALPPSSRFAELPGQVAAALLAGLLSGVERGIELVHAPAFWRHDGFFPTLLSPLAALYAAATVAAQRVARPAGGRRCR